MNHNKKNCCCSGNRDCCSPNQQEQTDKKLVIDFLYLDLSVCTRCLGTEKILEEAIEEVSDVLKAAGLDITVNKVNITTKELAIAHKFISSPTIRVNGHDIDAEVKETRCESCGELCGDDVDCRVWTYQGAEYTQPPKAMVINALLQSVYGAQQKNENKKYVLPNNLKKYFEAIENNGEK